MKFLIAGLGSIGRRHLRHLLALGHKDVLLYRTHQASLPDQELRYLPHETDLDKALAWGADAAIISNPTALHLDVAIPAARAGCHLLLEKPVSHNLDKLDELQAAVAENNVRILVGFQFRHHPSLRQIAELLSAGELGQPLSARAHWGEYLPDWHPWEDYRQGYAARKDLGGGVILTLTHPLDYLGWLLGEVKALWCFADKISDLELDVEDTAEIGLRFDNGVIGSVHLDYLQRPPRHQLEIVCSAGSIRWDHAVGLDVYHSDNDSWQHFPLPPDYERDQLFGTQIAHFIDVVQGTAQPVCTLQDGIRALELALAAHRSQDEKRLIDL